MRRTTLLMATMALTLLVASGVALAAAIGPETGEETEEYALYLCRKCAERS